MIGKDTDRMLASKRARTECAFGCCTEGNTPTAKTLVRRTARRREEREWRAEVDDMLTEAA